MSALDFIFGYALRSAVSGGCNKDDATLERKSRREARVNRLKSRREASKPEASLESLPIAILLSLSLLVLAFYVPEITTFMLPPASEFPSYPGSIVPAMVKVFLWWLFVTIATYGAMLAFGASINSIKKNYLDAMVSFSGSVACLSFAAYVASKGLHLF